MSSLMERVAAKARGLDIPFGAHIDLTWKCNERCVHCYLDHGAGGDMNTAEILRVLDELAAAGTMFLTLSGGEIMLRKDIFEIVAYARSLMFDVRLKTNATMIGEREAERFAGLGVRRVEISIYSHCPETHDAITLMPGSFAKSIAGVRHFKRLGVTVEIHASMMLQNAEDSAGIHALAAELGVKAKCDASIIPRLDGDRTPVLLSIAKETVRQIFNAPSATVEAEASCAPPLPLAGQEMDAYPCGAGHSLCYISPSGDVTPCVQYPVVCGNVRNQSLGEIWRSSPAFAAVRSVRVRDLPADGTCENCAGLAYMEGKNLGSSGLDRFKSPATAGVSSPLVQVSGAGPRHTNPERDVPFAGTRVSPPLVQIAGPQ